VAGSAVGGQFDMTASSQIPTLDCNFEPCADVVCGDGVVNGTEQCDDDETVPGDGCGSNCVLETGFACSGQPSTCAELLDGDRCDTAEPLTDGTFSLEGYTQDPTCDVGCEAPTRWFRVDVPGFHTVAVTTSTADMNFGQLAVYDLSKGPCHDLDWSELNMPIDESPRSFAWSNSSSFPRSFAVVVHDGFGGPVSSSFTVSHTVEPIGCGDGARDYGEFGAPEQCDDGNVAIGDGCSATCTVEPGWDCQNGPCVPVVCGDEVVAGEEACDDGGTEAEDGCSETCSVEPGYLCDDEEPSTCRPYQAEGDLCENAPPLADGSYSMSGYIPDLQCDDTCGGVDRWFSVDVPVGYTLAVRASTTNMFGRIEAFNATYGCGELGGANPGNQFSPGSPNGFIWINDYGSPQSIRVAVMDQESDPSENSFDLLHAVKPTGCGDFFRDQNGWYGMPEACDDGNSTNGDGCSNTCQVEPSYICSGNPSTCFIPQPGDECPMAQPLADDTYSMSGYTPELQCNYVCSGADRWFTTTVPAGQMIELDLSTTAPSSYMTLYQQVMGSCDGLMYLQGGFIMQDPGSRFYWYNDMPTPTNVALVLYQPEAPSSAQISVIHEVFTPHCGDGFVDGGGQYGPPEHCDDNNNLDGDSCPADCTFDP
jgi:cysteine-rich repeat protein